MVGIFVRNVHPSWTLNYSQWNVIISATETNLQPAVSEAGEESAIWTKLWMTNVQAQFGARKTEELFGRRSFIDRVLQEAFTCRRGRWIDALPRCVGYPFVPFVCAGKVNEASAAACNARFRKIISAAARSLAHREEERTREHEKTRHLTSQSDPTDTNRRARRETASPSDGAAEAARTMT